MNLRNVFITNLKKYRKEKKISQMKLSEICETSTSYIGEIEIGKKFPSIEMIQKFATALEIPAYKFFMEDTDCFTISVLPEKKQDLIQHLQNEIKKIIESEL